MYGDPDEVEDSRLEQAYGHVAQTYTGNDYTPGASMNGEKLYAYPHFQVSRSQLERLCNEPELLSRLAVDTYRADNYWNFFPTERTVSVFRKALAK